MRGLIVALGIAALALPVVPAHAAGCLSGAAVGGVAGHVAGHHGVLGAAAGCAIGHHQANKEKREQAAAQAQRNNNGPVGDQPNNGTGRN